MDLKEYLREPEEKSLTDKLFTLHWSEGPESHLGIIDTDVCAKNSGKECVLICPADVWRVPEGEVVPIIEWENCVECGACRVACPHDNVVWTWQQGGKGVSYKFG
ncbi:MAG: ferredoxin family protein [Candidatus Bipolaricaulia bacterium]